MKVMQSSARRRKLKSMSRIIRESYLAGHRMFTILISCHELSVRLRQSDPVIVDCRYNLMKLSAQAAKHISRIIFPALFILMHINDPSGPPVTNRGRHPLPIDEKINALFGSLGLSKNIQVVIYNDSYGTFNGKVIVDVSIHAA